MNYKTKIISLFIILLSIIIGLIWINTTKRNELPKVSFPTIEANVLYLISPHNSDAPSLSDGGQYEGVQQEYRILLQRGKTYYTDMNVDWRDAVYVALFEDNKLLGQTSCGWQARCNFIVVAEHDIWATLKVRSTGIKNIPFTVAVYDATGHGMFSGFRPKHNSDITAAPIPFIENDGVYHGTFYASNSPLFWTGKGSLNDYRISLNQDDTIMVKADSSGANIGVSLYNEEKRYAQGFKRGDDTDACFKVKIPDAGQYIIRVWTKDLQNKKSQDFILQLVRGNNAKLKECKS